MVIAISTAIPLLIAGFIMVWTAYRAYRRTLPMNFWIGIRTTTTLRSEDAWSVGHAAAAVPIAIGGFGLIAAAATAVVVGEDYAIVAAAVGCAWIAIWLVVGSVTAGRAARHAENSLRE
ncbi:SdpI family protein [Microbacterium xanthum]|uniref:SdpI family protein n=1 Tax=Microbacterium xanthum TaxID=3079794 RepID=UPI002AD419DC|nr:SdpI family protein [Microbacterium sp. KSW-48]MDZ8172472.1 SdpI family protein [Microbacterium sp. KSW-48]